MKLPCVSTRCAQIDLIFGQIRTALKRNEAKADLRRAVRLAKATEVRSSLQGEGRALRKTKVEEDYAFYA